MWHADLYTLCSHPGVFPKTASPSTFYKVLFSEHYTDNKICYKHLTHVTLARGTLFLLQEDDQMTSPDTRPRRISPSRHLSRQPLEELHAVRFHIHK